MQKFKKGDKVIYHRYLMDDRETGSYEGIITDTKLKDHLYTGNRTIKVRFKNDWLGRNRWLYIEIKYLEKINNHETKIAENYSI